MKKVFEEAMGKEEDAHTSKSRSEAFHQNLFALHDQIYRAQNHRKQMELDQSSMFTGSEFKCVQEELERYTQEIEKAKIGYKDAMALADSEARKRSDMDRRIVKAYEHQENSTVDLYMLRETHTPRPVLDKATVLNVAKEKFSKMTEDLRYYSVTTGEILKEELNNSGLPVAFFENCTRDYTTPLHKAMRL